MLALFWQYGITPMVYFNCFSIAFYLLMFVCLHRGLWGVYVVGTYLEVLAHMYCAVLFVGWDSGFQITLIGMNILVFYAEYVLRSKRNRHLPALPFSLMGMGLYLGSFVITKLSPPAYALPSDVSFWLQIAWGVIVFVINITFLQIFVLLTFHSEEWLNAQANHDTLTGLPNRHHMMDYLTQAKNDTGLHDRWAAMVDIDDFKRINDTYGHNCGDEALKSLAEILTGMGAQVECCRWGGEEFLLVGKLDGEGKVPTGDIERLRTAVEGHFFWYKHQRLSFTITIGAAPYEQGQSVSEWINAADHLLYEGKQGGKNCVVAA